MISEGEFWVLKRLQEKPVLVKGGDESYEDFDLACEHARDLLNRGLIHTGAADPFRKNRGLSGGRYLGAGKFDLSASAIKITGFEDFAAFKASLPNKSPWTLGARLTLFGVIVAIIAVIVALL
jgi:hypothetical protein